MYHRRVNVRMNDSRLFQNELYAPATQDLANLQFELGRGRPNVRLLLEIFDQLSDDFWTYFNFIVAARRPSHFRVNSECPDFEKAIRQYNIGG